MPTCGQCRHPNGDRYVVSEMDKEIDKDDDDNECMEGLHYRIDEYRQASRHLGTHYEGSFLWHMLPYRIDTSTWWSLYFMLLLNFADLFSDRIMYVHSVVEMPIEPTWEVQVAVYRLFFYNTPFDAFYVITSIQSRLFFLRSAR